MLTSIEKLSAGLLEWSNKVYAIAHKDLWFVFWNEADVQALVYMHHEMWESRLILTSLSMQFSEFINMGKN